MSGHATREQAHKKRRAEERTADADAAFEDRSPEAQARRRDLPLVRPAGETDWCRTYLPQYFDRRFAPFHGRMARAVGKAGLPTFVAAFRGAGKSALLALARPLRCILRGECPYVLFGSQVQKLAAYNMEFIRVELDRNARIRCDYGAVSTGGPHDAWSVELAEEVPRPGPFVRCRLEAFGIGMSPRGRRFQQWRPWEFVGDDLECAELARNPDREQQLWDWLMDEVVPALEPDRFRFTVLGTMFGPGCMMERAASLARECDEAGAPLARVFRQPAVTDGRSVWPDRFTDAALARVRRMIGLRNWLRNYALVAEDPSRPFQASWLGEYDPSAVDRARLDVVCFLDPAVSRSAQGCPRARRRRGRPRDRPPLRAGRVD